MAIRGTATVSCPGCGKPREAQLVQSINARTQPDAKEKLLAGDLNVLDCTCGKRTQLGVTLLYVDPDAEFYCQVVPGGNERAMDEAAAAFAAAGATGTQRLVPSLNALVEKVKILDAGLVDWALEMNKLLLLASRSELNRVLLFDAKEAELIHWLLFDDEGRRGAPARVSSPLASYEKLLMREQGQPKRGELRIDRAWAMEAVQTMIAGAN